MSDIHRHRVWNTKRKLYLYQRNTVIDNLGQLYEVKSGLKPLNMDIHIIEKCLGWRDKNYNMIYEGDIFEHPTDGERFYIRYKGDSFKAFYEDGQYNRIGPQIGDRGLAVIIGNIRENPELIKVKG